MRADMSGDPARRDSDPTAEQDLCPDDMPSRPVIEAGKCVDPARRVPSTWRRVYRPAAAALFAYIGLSVLLFHRAWMSPNSSNVGGPGDPIAIMWALRWTPYALSHGQGPFLTGHLNYPFGVNLMWNSPIVLHSLALWPVTAAFGPVAAYNTLATLNIAVSAWCAYLVCARFVDRAWAAFGGGLFYGFSPYMMAQSRDHLTLTAAYIPPLLLLVLYEVVVRQRRSFLPTGLALGALCACQLLIAEEMLACEALVAGLTIAVAMALKPRAVVGRMGHALKAMAVAAGFFVVATVWPLIVQFLGPNRIRGGTAQPPNVFVSDLANFFVPTDVQHFVPGWASARAALWTGNLSEFDAYLGIPLLLVLVLVVVRHWGRPSVRVAAIVGVAVAVLSLGPNLHINGRDTMIALPWRGVAVVPLVKNILPARLMLFVDLAATLLVALFLDDIVHARSWSLRLGGGATIIVLAASLLPVVPYPSSLIATPKFFTDGSAAVVPSGSVALVAPFQQLYPAEPMLWQAETGMRFRMPQGYFFGPDANGRSAYGAPVSIMSTTMLAIQGGQTPLLTDSLRRRILADLAQRRVDTVVVGPVDHRQNMLDLFTFVLGRAPELVSDVDLWRDVASLARDGER